MTIRSARYLSRTLQYDADAGCFRCYAKTKTPLTVYRGETSSLWYTTQPKMHDHQLVETGRREPTCTMSGWIDFRCTICGELRRQPLEPLGHEVVNGICVRCGEVMQLPFRDVPEDAYYYDAVVWGLSRGVVNGTTMTTFSPDLHPRAGSHVPVACCRETGALRQYGLCRCPGGQLLCRGRRVGGGERLHERHGRRLLQPGCPVHARTDRHVPVACGRGAGVFRQYGLCGRPRRELLCRGRCLGGGEQRYERHRQRLLQPG